MQSNFFLSDLRKLPYAISVAPGRYQVDLRMPVLAVFSGVQTRQTGPTGGLLPHAPAGRGQFGIW